MEEIVLTLFLLAPIVSKNPVAQDTVAPINFHVEFGYRPASDVIGFAPEMGAKFEYLLFHPIILTGFADYSISNIRDLRLPEGQNHAVDLGVEALLYRGTKKLTAYLGAGLVYSINHFELRKQLTDSLYTNSGIYKTEIDNKYGYRVIMGFRVREHFSFEFGYQETRPKYLFWGNSPDGHKIVIYKDAQLSAVRFTLGYLFSL